MSAHRWIELSLLLPASYHDLLTGQLADLGFTGFLQEDTVLAAYLAAAQWTPAKEARVRAALARFRKEFPRLGSAFTVRTVKEENWNARWERSAGIVEATNRIIIKPSWKKLRVRDRGKLVLHIDPKMSFGTGHHETTRLCLVLLEEYVKRGTKVLDIGCGTGVLSIAAAKLGASKVLGVDADEWAYNNARENIKRNRVKTVRILRGTLARVPSTKFNVIMSNIDLPTNLRQLPSVIRRLLPDGTIILSGLLTSDLAEFMRFLQGRAVAPTKCLEENGWVAVALEKVRAD